MQPSQSAVQTELPRPGLYRIIDTVKPAQLQNNRHGSRKMARMKPEATPPTDLSAHTPMMHGRKARAFIEYLGV